LSRHDSGVIRNSFVRALVCSAILQTIQGCGSGGGDGGDSTAPPAPTSGVSGVVSFERVPFESAGTGLDYSGTFEAPARGVVVELLDADQNVLATTETDGQGRYEFDAPQNTEVRVRARARLRHASTGAGDPGWDVEIRNNTNSNALYTLSGALQNTGSAGQVRNLLAETGWAGFGGSSYTGTRAAAPFAIADSIYEAIQFLLENGDAELELSPLDVYWSTGNRPVSGDSDYSDGEIGSTAYHIGGASPTGIYVLGDDGLDTDEYDQHVLIHEFMHYLEQTISRTDNVGGVHFLGDQLDMRVAFSEGFGDAFAAMVLGDPVYRDSMGAAQGDEFTVDMDDNTRTNAGWFNEFSVASIAWDLFDTDDDGADRTSTGFAPMYDVITHELRDGPALTSLFVFISALKQRTGVDAGAVNAIVAEQSIVAVTIDPYGSTETNDGGVDEALPLYTDVALNGATERVCTSATEAASYNTIGNRRFLTFNVPSDRPIDIRVVGLGTALPGQYPGPDPDLIVYQSGFIDFSDCAGPDGGSCTEPQNTERLELDATAGDYVLEVYDYSHIDPSAGLRPPTCMNVSITG
jgi:hypothetical protein